MTDVEALFHKAAEALAAAHYTLNGGFLTTAINRAYYAAFYAARAALLTLGEVPKTHQGVILRFNLHFVKTGRLDAHVASILSFAEDLREGADYDVALNIEPDAVTDLIADVERFVEAVERLFGMQGS